MISDRLGKKKPRMRHFDVKICVPMTTRSCKDEAFFDVSCVHLGSYHESACHFIAMRPHFYLDVTKAGEFEIYEAT